MRRVIKRTSPRFNVVNHSNRFAIVSHSLRYVIKHLGDNLATIPSGILLNPDGEPLLDPDGNYILAGS